MRLGQNGSGETHTFLTMFRIVVEEDTTLHPLFFLQAQQFVTYYGTLLWVHTDQAENFSNGASHEQKKMDKS